MAQTLIERAMQLKQDVSPQVHYHYAVILMKVGDSAKAKTELEAATRDNPDYFGVEDAKKLLSKQ